MKAQRPYRVPPTSVKFDRLILRHLEEGCIRYFLKVLSACKPASREAYLGRGLGGLALFNRSAPFFGVRDFIT